MKSVVVFKWAIDPRDIRVNADGSVDWSAVSPWVGDDDCLAVQVACSASGQEGEVTGLTLAGGDVAFAAARGAQRTVAIEGLPATADAMTVAKALAEAIHSFGDVDVVVIGDSAWEPSVPVMLGGLLGWTTVMAVDEAKFEGGKLHVTRRFGTGTQELCVSGPIVLGVAAKREEENKPGMRAVITARKKPVTTIQADELMKESVPAFTLHSTHLPEATPSRLFDGEDPDGAVSQLVQALQADGVF